MREKGIEEDDSQAEQKCYSLVETGKGDLKRMQYLIQMGWI